MRCAGKYKGERSNIGDSRHGKAGQAKGRQIIETYQDCKAEKNDIGEEVSRLGETARLRLEAARVSPYLTTHEHDEYLQKGFRTRLTKVGIKKYA